MKNLFFVITLMAGCYSSFGQIKSASLTASGLTCSMCSKSIFKALEKLPSVASVDVNIDESVFNIKFKEGATVLPDDVKKAVVSAGFAVASLKFTADLPVTSIGNDTHIKFAGATYHFLNVLEQTISGEKTFTIVDKNFTSAAEVRRFRKSTKMKCYETGKAESCCAADITPGSRIYHITL